jgi:hypothetical protein
MLVRLESSPKYIHLSHCLSDVWILGPPLSQSKTATRVQDSIVRYTLKIRWRTAKQQTEATGAVFLRPWLD